MNQMKTLAAGAALLALSGAGAFAADLATPAFASPEPAETPTELGTGWYLRGDIGFKNDRTFILDAVGNISAATKRTGFELDVGAGYQFNQWFRIDGTLEFHNINRKNYTAPVPPCQVGAAAVLNLAGTVVGSTPITQSCNGLFQSRATRVAALINGYIDLGTWSSITPYIGAGVGTARLQSNSSATFITSSNVDTSTIMYTDPFSGAQGRGQPHVTTKQTKYGLAWAAMAGIAVDIAPHAKLDVGYRYASYGSLSGVDAATGRTVNRDITSQEIRAGIRYLID